MPRLREDLDGNVAGKRRTTATHTSEEVAIASPSRAEQLRAIRRRERRLKPVTRSIVDGMPDVITVRALRSAFDAGALLASTLVSVQAHVRKHQDRILEALTGDPERAIFKADDAISAITVDEIAALQVGDLIAGLSDRQLRTAQEALAVLFERGPTADVLAMISDATGLTRRQLRAVNNAHLSALDDGLSKAAAARAAARARKRLLKMRAQLIARTESVRLTAAITQRFGIETLGATQKRWISARDNDVEGICLALDKPSVVVGINDPFPTGHMHPPAHAGCRCVLELL